MQCLATVPLHPLWRDFGVSVCSDVLERHDRTQLQMKKLNEIELFPPIKKIAPDLGRVPSPARLPFRHSRVVQQLQEIRGVLKVGMQRNRCDPIGLGGTLGFVPLDESGPCDRKRSGRLPDESAELLAE